MKQSRRPEARDLILDLFVTRRGVAHDLTMLCRAGAAFGISGGAVRTALARLKREGRIESIGRGRYAPASGPDAIRGRIIGWRQVLARRRTWSHGWLVVATGPGARAHRTTWRRIQRALRLEGFHQVEAELFARPDNLVGGAAGARARLHELGLPRTLVTGRLSDIDPAILRTWIALWRVDWLRAGYDKLASRLNGSARRLAGRDDAAAAAECLSLGREAVHAILQDPLLPDEIAPNDALHELISAMAKYDVLGKTVWRGYLRHPAGGSVK